MKRVSKFLVGLIAALTALPALALAQGDEGFECRSLDQRVAFPGFPIGASVAEVSKSIPLIGSCDPDYGCSFHDRHGYENRLQDGFLFRKEALRAYAPWLPFGVAWTDGAAEVARKVEAAGAPVYHDSSRRNSPFIVLDGCFNDPQSGYEFWLTFYFSPKSGRLSKVVQATIWP